MAVPAHGLYGIDSCRSSSDAARRCCDDNLVQNFGRERARARRERGQKGSIPSRKSIDPGLCANSGMRAVAEAVIVSHGNPIVALTKWSRVAGSVGVFSASDTFSVHRARAPKRAFASEIGKTRCFTASARFVGFTPAIQELSTVHGDATVAQRHRPQIFAERTANANE